VRVWGSIANTASNRRKSKKNILSTFFVLQTLTRWFMATEAQYQRGLIERISKRFPECVVLRNKPDDVQGIPDLLIIHGDRWAMLEVKASYRSRVQPNQSHHVASFNDLSYAAFIYPENEEEILNDLQQALGVVR